MPTVSGLEQLMKPSKARMERSDRKAHKARSDRKAYKARSDLKAHKEKRAYKV